MIYGADDNGIENIENVGGFRTGFDSAHNISNPGIDRIK